MNHAGILAKTVLIATALIVAINAHAQIRHKQPQQSHEADHPAPATPADKRDIVVVAPGPFNGRSYWLALAQCGGIYFKLNTLYTDAAVHARVVKPDPKANAEFTKGLTEAIKTATVYFNGAEHFLMTDRGIERSDAVLVYEGQSRTAGDRFKTIDAALAATEACPALYQACQAAYPKSCSDPLAPVSGSLPQGSG
jgi:hypothetical protein